MSLSEHKIFPLIVDDELWFCVRLEDGTFFPVDGPFRVPVLARSKRV